MWHGNAASVIEHAEDFDYYPIDHLEDNRQKKKYDKVKTFQAYLADFDKYIANSQSFIVNYTERYRYGEFVSTGFVGFTVNSAIAKRFSKKPSMQWTRKGAHLLLPVRTKVLNKEWKGVFRKLYPDIRPIISVKDPDKVQKAAWTSRRRNVTVLMHSIIVRVRCLAFGMICESSAVSNVNRHLGGA